MNRLRFLSLLLVAVLPALAQAPRADASRTDPFARTVARINALLAHRLSPPAFEPGRLNPFHIGPLPGTVVRQPDNPVEQSFPASSDETVLAQLAATLKINGVVAREDRTFVIVDGAARREGDFIILSHRGAPVNIRVKRVETNRLVLGLNDAEFTLRF